MAEACKLERLVSDQALLDMEARLSQIELVLEAIGADQLYLEQINLRLVDDLIEQQPELSALADRLRKIQLITDAIGSIKACHEIMELKDPQAAKAFRLRLGYPENFADAQWDRAGMIQVSQPAR